MDHQTPTFPQLPNASTNDNQRDDAHSENQLREALNYVVAPDARQLEMFD